MRAAAALIALLFAVAGCGQKDDGLPAGRSDTRQVPTQTEPGLHVSGHVNVGVLRTF